MSKTVIEYILDDLKEQVLGQERLYGPTLNSDAKDWVYSTGILLSVRQAKILIDFIKKHKEVTFKIDSKNLVGALNKNKKKK